MKKIILIFVCVLFNSVNSECVNSTCASKIVSDILKDKTVLENIDIKLEVPKFKQIKNVGIEDLNQILLYLTSWFESRLNDTNFVFKHVSNKTKVFVKSFDFNVDFEKGNAKIDVDLTEESSDKKENITENKEIKTTTPKISTKKAKITTTTAKITTTTAKPTKTIAKSTTTTAKPTKTTAKSTTTTAKPTTTTSKTTTTTESLIQEQIAKTKNKTEQMDKLIAKLANEKQNELFKLEEFDSIYYDSNEDNSTDYPIFDYVEMYKDTTNEENLYIPTTNLPEFEDKFTGGTSTELNYTEIIVPRPTADPDPICHGDPSCQEFTSTVFPWIASIFITNSSQDNQFSYYCDGVLITDKVIVTDARCMIVNNKTLDPDSMLIFLGKVNLQSFGGNETIHKVDSIIIHPNFTAAWEGNVTNDLALIVLDEAVQLKDNVQSACIHQERDAIEESASTAWSLDGELVPIFFNREKGDNCFDKDEDVFCATYGNEVPYCPSYGGIFASRQVDRWCLTGIFFGEPAERGICFSKNVHYTALTKHLKWIDETVGMFKNRVV